MIHPDDRDYLKKEKAKIHDAYDTTKTLTDLLLTQAYQKGYARAKEEMREEGITLPTNPKGFRGDWPKAVQ